MRHSLELFDWEDACAALAAVLADEIYEPGEWEADLCDEFRDALQTLKSAPAVRSVAPRMYQCICNWAGACDRLSLAELEPIANSLNQQLTTFLTAEESCLGSLAQECPPQLIQGLFFALACVCDIYDYMRQVPASLYWHWISLLLIDAFAHNCNEELLRTATSQPILSLVLPAKKAGLAAPDFDVETLTKLVSLNGDIAGALVGTESGHDVLKRLLMTFTLECDEKSTLVKMGQQFVETLCAALNTAWYAPLAPSLSLKVSAPVMFAGIVMKSLHPVLVQQSRSLSGLSHNAHLRELAYKQSVAGLYLKTLSGGLPELFADDESIREHYMYDENSYGDEEMANELRTLQKHLKATAVSPWLSFVCLIACTMVDRKDARDRTCAILVDCIYNHPPFCTRAVELLLNIANTHDKPSVRLPAMELVVTIFVKTVDSLKDAYLAGVLEMVMLRITDTNSTVRARSIDLLALLLDTVGDAMFNDAENIEESSNWRRFTLALHARVIDEKSAVRKSCVTLADSLIRALGENVFQVIQPQLVELLADDAAITVRVKCVSVLTGVLIDLPWLKDWAIEADEDSSSQASNCFFVVFRNILRLAADPEEAVYSKVLEFVAGFVVPMMTDSIQQNQLDAVTVSLFESESLSQRYIRTLMRILEGEQPAWVQSIVALINVSSKTISARLGSTEQLESLPNRALSHVLYLHVVAMTTGNQSVSVMKMIDASMLFLILFEHLMNKEMLYNEGWETASMCLDMMITILPNNVVSRNRTLVYRSFETVLFKGVCHPALYGKLASICYLLAPNTEEFLLQVLSNGKSALTSLTAKNNPDLKPQQIANACLACGFVSLVAQCTDTKHTKLLKYFRSIDKALAVTILTIVNGSETPQWLRSVALLSAGQILLSSEKLAKALITSYLECGLKPALNQAGWDMSTINVTSICADATVSMTSVMDPFITLITATLASGGAPDARFAVLVLIADLISQDYIKCKGLIVHHLLFAMGDASPDVANLAFNIVQTVLLPRVKDLLILYFVETVCFMTGYDGHPSGIKYFESHHPLQKEVVRNVHEKSVGSFAAGWRHRWLVYSKLLMISQEQSKHLLTSKITQDFLGPLCEVETLPADASSPCGTAISDVLVVLGSKDMKLRFRSLETGEGEGEAEAKKSRYERDLMKSYLRQTVVPCLVSFYEALRTQHSGLQKNVVVALARMVGAEYAEELEELLGDGGVRRLVCREAGAARPSLAELLAAEPVSSAGTG